MDTKRAAAIVTAVNPHEPSRANAGERLLSETAVSQRQERQKRRRSDRLKHKREVTESQRKRPKSGQLEKLCKTCGEFAKWFSYTLPRAEESFTHKDLSDVRTSASNCSLCHMIYTEVRLRGEFSAQAHNRPLLIGYPKSEFFLDTDGSVAYIWIWEGPHAYAGIYVRLAVFTDKACGIENISCSPPSSTEPCLQTFHLIKSWLQSCVHHHDECKITIGNQRVDETQMAILPKRVLDVGKTSEQYIRLVEPLHERGHYCALSHCWGAEKPLMTTVDTLSSHLAGIRLQQLPKTFLEAVEITRGIGIRYLWIDSLCILQGDKQDWHEQAEHMGMLYAHAYLTIAASGAKNSTEGCFMSTDTQESKVQLPFYNGEGGATGYFCLSLSGKYSSVWVNNPYYGPLRERAWALQEWILSRRMLHCTRGGLIWKCKQTCLDERDVPKSTEGRDANWNEMIRTYTRSMLTDPADRLIALRGMINAIQQIRPDRNYFGIWSSDIPASLLWSVNRPEGDGMKGMKKVPSWSWAAKDGVKDIWKIWSSEARKHQGVGTTWMQNNIANVIGFVDSDASVIAVEGYLVSCYAARRMDEYAATHDISSPEIFLGVNSRAEWSYTIRLKDDSLDSGLIGIAVMDNDYGVQDEEGRQGDDSTEIFCAYMVAGERTKKDPYLLENFRLDFSCNKENCGGINLCDMCKAFGTPKSKTFYWVLILQPISQGSDHYRRMGLGIVWNEPSGSMQKYYIE